MLTKYLGLISRSRPLSFTFATSAVKDQLNYYNILEVNQGATETAIRAAYAELTQGLNPKSDSSKFNQLNQALVILTDNKTRDAYDSLLKVRKTYYLSPEEDNVPATKSYLSQRRDNRLQELKKKLNIDEFGRYKGGLPQRFGELRGKSKAEIGSMHRAREIEEELDRFPQFNNVTAQKAESFKNFHQDQRQARQMKWPWFSFEVDYEYFTFKTFRKKYWPKIQFLILIFYIVPTLYYAILKLQKQQAVQELKKKALKAGQQHQEASHTA